MNTVFENPFSGGEAGPAEREHVDRSEGSGLGGLDTQKQARGGLVTGNLAESSGPEPILYSCGVGPEPRTYYIWGRGRRRDG